MTRDEQKEFKVLIKEGALEALKSSEGQDAIVGAMRSQGGQSAIIDAMKSSGGQGAIVGAMNSMDGQQAIKKGSLAALKSEEGQQVLVKSFVEGYHAMVEPNLEDISHDVKTIKIELKYMKDKYGAKIERLERKVGLTV